MTDKPSHLRAVPDLPPEEAAPQQPDDGIIREVPGYRPAAPRLTVPPEVITEMPPADPNAPAVEVPKFETPTDSARAASEEQASVDNHPSNIR